jgi:hypothetical protein
MSIITRAPAPILDIVEKVKSAYHTPRLELASIAVCLTDAKPFRGGKINLGKTSKFSNLNRLWQEKKHDFCITLCADLWYQILNESQREALIDLHLTCCSVEYEPVTVTVNDKERPVKDEWGRLQYTDQFKFDDDGNPKWKVKNLDFLVFADNARRYDLWLKDVIDGLDGLTVVKN